MKLKTTSGPWPQNFEADGQCRSLETSESPIPASRKESRNLATKRVKKDQFDELILRSLEP